MTRRWVIRIAYELEIEADDADKALEEVLKFQAVKRIRKHKVVATAGAVAEIANAPASPS